MAFVERAGISLARSNLTNTGRSDNSICDVALRYAAWQSGGGVVDQVCQVAR